jgi:hypothetical protein
VGWLVGWLVDLEARQFPRLFVPVANLSNNCWDQTEESSCIPFTVALPREAVYCTPKMSKFKCKRTFVEKVKEKTYLKV